MVDSELREMMEFVSFEDQAGLYETVLFPQAYRRYAREVHTAQPLLVTGTVHQEFGACTVHVTRVARLSTATPPQALARPSGAATFSVWPSGRPQDLRPPIRRSIQKLRDT